MNVAAPSLLVLALLAAQVGPQEAFTDAKQTYATLQKDKQRSKQRAPYDKLIKQLTQASQKKGDKADDCLYFAATIAEDLYGQSGVAADLEKAIDLNVDVADGFKTSSLADDALLRAARLTLSRRGDRDGARTLLQRARKEYPKGDQASAIDELLARLPAEKEERVAQKPAASKSESNEQRIQQIIQKVTDETKGSPDVEVEISARNPEPGDVPPLPIRGLSIQSGKGNTQIALGMDGAVSVKTGTAPAAKGIPFRFYADISPATSGGLGKQLKGWKDARVVGARAAQFDARTVRVVFELKSEMPGTALYDDVEKRVLITLGAPAALPVVVATRPAVVEESDSDEHPTPQGVILRAEALTPDAGPTVSEVKELARALEEDRATVSLSAQAGLKVRRVVIDAGHGGHDTGAIGPTGVREADVTLKIARKVAARLRKELKMEVILTRDKDVFIPLEERTRIANEAHADLFISIHCNSNPNRRIYGVETYYLNITDDNYAMRLAARENKSSARTVSDLQFILADLAMKSNVDDSVRLSKLVQANVVGELREGYTGVKDLGVKHALFYVLIGAKMPAILVETSFVSNKTEEQRLNSSKYQDTIAEGLVQGVRHFMEERQALAH